MTAQDLKNSILQQAIQGKLVPQNPSDEPASELLKKIAAERQKLIDKGKIKNAPPLPPIEDDEKPFDIPDNWKWGRLGDLSYSIQYGYTASAIPSGKIKILRISDIQNNSVDWDRVPFCEIEDREIDNYLLKINDILFARTGGTVGKSLLVESLPTRAIFASYLIRTNYHEDLFPHYLKAFMESPFYWTQLKAGTLGTAQPNCNGKKLSKMIIPLPPLAEQKRIVAKLEELMPLCDSLSKKIKPC